jgi:hypothetical protein
MLGKPRADHARSKRIAVPRTEHQIVVTELPPAAIDVLRLPHRPGTETHPLAVIEHEPDVARGQFAELLPAERGTMWRSMLGPVARQRVRADPLGNDLRQPVRLDRCSRIRNG